MSGILERYDEATRDEARHLAVADQALTARENCLYALHRDGMTIREIAQLVGLSTMKAQRMIKRARDREA